MSVSNTGMRFVEWQELLDEGRELALKKKLLLAPLVEVADFIAGQEDEVAAQLFSLFDSDIQAGLFGHFEEEQQFSLYNLIPRRVIGELFSYMDSNLRADFYQKLNNQQQAKLLPFLSKSVLKDVITLSTYPTDTAGGIMNTDFLTLDHEMTAQEALALVVKEAPSKKEIYYLYVLDEDKKMRGLLSLRDLLAASSDTKINGLLRTTFIYGRVEDDREEVARKIEKYHLFALPILNDEERLVGIIPHDDALDVLREEQTEDMSRFMGIMSEGESSAYLSTPSIIHFARRIGWVAGLFVASFVAAFILHQYEGFLSQWAILLFYLPTINDAGGNTGSQAATVVTRALTLKEITVQDWVRVLFKELQVALMFVGVLFFISYFKVIIFSGWLGSEVALIQEKGIALVAFTIALAICLQVVTSMLIGALLPLFVKWLGGDPVTASSPAITTIVDVTGLVIYLNVAQWLLLS